ncbi:hypothetical protein J4216_03760 [Candidatus Woesearchaeota archaeon]|nr:hypothetical protein [Candidatus Woesearchaeota archaeon]
MYIRLKKVKKGKGSVYEYAHLVEGVWKKRKQIKEEIQGPKFRRFNNSTHKYIRFLGRVYHFEEDLMRGDQDLKDFENLIKNLSVKELYYILIGNILLSRGFIKKENAFFNGDFSVDLNSFTIRRLDQEVVLKLLKRGGYLCKYSLEELFKVDRVNNREEGLFFMKKLKMVGIELNANLFFILVSKLLKESNKPEN